MTGRRIDEMVIDDRERGIFRVHRSSMYSHEIWELERTRIFDACWVYVGHESEIAQPGDYLRRTVAGRPLILVRGIDGVVRVLLNTCMHRGAVLCRQDRGNTKTFQCFYHAWTFDTAGELIAIPGEDAYPVDFDRSELALKAPPKVESYRGFVFASFNPKITDLASYLAGAKEYLDLIVDQSPVAMRVVPGANKYSIQANWKLLVENSVDGYHGGPVHQTYFDYIASLGQSFPRGQNSSGRDLGNGHALIQSDAPYGRPIAKWHPLFGDAAKPEIEKARAALVEKFGEERAHAMADTIRNLLIFPNLIVNDIMAITIRTIEPVSESTMLVSSNTLAPEDESAEALARRLDSYLTFIGPGGFATPDDIEALESCQLGFRAKEAEWSDISRGMGRMPNNQDELQMRTFWRAWSAYMRGEAPTQRVTDIERPLATTPT